MAYAPPPLKRHEGGWAVIRLADGVFFCELWRDDPRVPLLNSEKYKLVPIAEYLHSLSV